MIVHYFYIVRVLFTPDETDTVLVIDPDTMLSGALTLQRFKAVSWQRRQIGQARGAMNLAKLTMRDASYTLEFWNPLAIKYRLSVAVAKAPDHSNSITRVALYVKHTTRHIKRRVGGGLMAGLEHLLGGEEVPVKSAVATNKLSLSCRCLQALRARSFGSLWMTQK
jgi:hypothetical protein